MQYQLAQLNVATLRAPIDDVATAGFVAALDPINALAEASPGFVWRLQTEDGNATSVQAFDDPRVIVNLTVWTTLGALQDFVYKTAHADVLRSRREWFCPAEQVSVVLWWVPDGTLPTVDDAKTRLAHLREHGVSAYAFTFRTPFDPSF